VHFYRYLYDAVGRDYLWVERRHWNDQALAEMLERAETNSAFYGDLKTRCAAIAPMFEPHRERQAWAGLLLGLET